MGHPPAGTIQNDSEYYPYGGERIYTQGAVNQNYRFTGKERDSESGLDNFGARQYASTMGRFMTPDWDVKPVTVPYATFGDPQSLNLYTYVENEPVNRVDADGHSCAGYSTTNIATGQSCEQLNPANTNAEQSSQTTLTEAQAQNQAQLNIQVIRSDNLSNSGQAAVNGQLGDMKADMAKIGIGVNITSDSTRSNIDLKNPGSFNKGAIPYFFVTSKEAGSSTSGSGFFGKKVGVVINEFANSGDKVVATHETLHILRGDIYAGKNGASWGRELHVRWETFKLEHGWTGGMGWLTDAARNPPNQ